MAVYYNTCIDYIRCASGAKEKIARLQEIIDILDDSILEGQLKGHLNEYSLDDGQTKIKEVFVTVKDTQDAILALEQRIERIKNKCIGRRYGLMDGKVIIR